MYGEYLGRDAKEAAAAFIRYGEKVARENPHDSHRKLGHAVAVAFFRAADQDPVDIERLHVIHRVLCDRKPPYGSAWMDMKRHAGLWLRDLSRPSGAC